MVKFLFHNFKYKSNQIAHFISDANYVYIEKTYCDGEIIDVYSSLQDAKDECRNDQDCKCIYDDHCAGNHFFTTSHNPTSTTKGSCTWGKSKLRFSTHITNDIRQIYRFTP